jgi:small-conductance mechanosensitive channel
VALASGCGPREAPDPGSSNPPRSLDELLLDGQILGDLISVRSLVVIAIVIGAAYAIAKVFDTAVHLIWRLGFDTDRRLAGPASLVRLILAGLAVLVLARSALHAAPLLASAMALALVIGALFTSGFFADALTGLGLAFRSTLRVGDRVTIGKHQGIVREIKLTKLKLRGPDGSTILIPNRLFNHHPVDIERARNTVPVTVAVELIEPSQACIRALRRSLVISPYRAPGTPVDVTSDLVNSKVCSFEVQVWSARALREAKAQLQATLERALQVYARDEIQIREATRL